jgi:hypothetical protein
MRYTNRAREVGDSAAARFAGSAPISLFRSWGLRPRLYSATCSAGSGRDMGSALLLRRFRARHGSGLLLRRFRARHSSALLLRRFRAKLLQALLFRRFRAKLAQRYCFAGSGHKLNATCFAGSEGDAPGAVACFNGSDDLVCGRVDDGDVV